eukprot:TRINITY_DN1992_c0_g1_i17.p1 TRINITY_DN1992_c0_g1~~TRINITY_DN1992_c0_g1_i17.p1  ORF type:complete len:105 (-),score=22.09 TRINITY_DN1992_c0_g1_i17:366-680(-)
MSGMQEICIENNIKGLGDGGYHSVFLKTPLRLPINTNELQYNETQRSLRAIVEVLQGLVQFWSAAGERFTLHNLALHAQSLMSCYHLEQMKLLNKNPFNPPSAL